MSSKTIVFIHGMFVTKHCWDLWIPYFEAKGYKCYAPAWPLKDSTPAELRAKHPDYDGEGRVRLSKVIETYERFINQLPEKPILIGHSMGGLVTQILVQKGLVEKAVTIDSAPAQGIFTFKFSFLKANWPVLNPLESTFKPAMWTKNQFKYAFADHLAGDDLDKAYESVVPQSKMVPRDSLGGMAKIDFKAKTIPLLMISGDQDNIVPEELNKAMFKKYSESKSVTEFKEFPGKSHYLINDKGWEEIAEYIYNWLQKVK